MVAPLATWPWESLGSFKYALYGPFLAKILYARHQEDSSQAAWCLHILVLCALRGLMYQLWTSYSNMLFLTRTRRIIKQGIDFKQIDKEWDWDNFILLQASIATLAFYMFPALGNIPLWDTRGFIAAVVLHVAISEPFYYLTHKRFHGNYLFNNYHALHHSSPVPQPFTAGHLTFFEHLLLACVIGIPIIGACLLGFGSVMMIYSYVLTFDLLRSLGHCNIEIVPHQIFESFPFLRYLIYTPTYHSLHHTEMGTNICLFMPLYDLLGKTLNSKSWDMHKKISIDAGKIGRVPDFVFLAHVVDMTSAMHVPFAFRSYGSMPFTTKVILLPCLPLCFIIMLLMWAKSKTFLVTFYNLRGRLHQTWSVPRFGFQYFLPFAADGINKHIEEAILRADRLGVKVISLAALNKVISLSADQINFVIEEKE